MNKKLPKILVVDDEEYTRVYFKRILSPEYYNVSLVKDGSEALQRWSSESFDLIIMDIRMPDIDGMEALKRIRMLDTETMVIIISAYGDMDSVIEAMRLGANDFFAKPFSSIDKIKLDIKNCLERRSLLRENEQLKEQICSGIVQDSMIYSCKVMETVIEQATRIARLEMPVLIEGESGTGKELIARHIHSKSSRAQAPFFAVNCGALSETLLEPALFGYEKGAFTGANAKTLGYFEAAGGGTIFLDEISETSPSFQVKLLRVLQEGEFMRVGGTKTIKVDFRLVSATNMDIAGLVGKGVFRKDLLYRINVIKIDVPPLRERIQDIPLLLDHFMHQVCEHNKIRKKKFSPEVLTCLMQHAWEGNVRELRNLVERLAVLSRHQMITVEDLPHEYKCIDVDCKDQHSLPLNFEQAKSLFESTYYKKLFAAAGGDLKKASAMSGLNLSTLYRRKNKLNA
ncbi:MAG: sigma-54 dependent transcriptional regulator [Smithella sp.]|jgi:DNA-binding NtrC family response regulator